MNHISKCKFVFPCCELQATGSPLQTAVLGLLTSPDDTVKQTAARLFNAFASLCAGQFTVKALKFELIFCGLKFYSQVHASLLYSMIDELIPYVQ